MIILLLLTIIIIHHNNKVYFFFVLFLLITNILSLLIITLLSSFLDVRLRCLTTLPSSRRGHDGFDTPGNSTRYLTICAATQHKQTLTRATDLQHAEIPVWIEERVARIHTSRPTSIARQQTLTKKYHISLTST